MKPLLVSLCTLAFAATAAHGATLVGFSDGTNSPASATTIEPGIVSGSLAFGPGLIKTDNGANEFFVGGDPVGSNWDLADALNGDYYYSVTITPNATSSLSFTGATFETFSQNDDRTFYLFSDVTGFAEGDVLGSFLQSSTAAGAAGTAHTIDLSGSGLTSLTSTTEFRLYFTNEDSANIYEDSGLRASGTGANFVLFDGSVSSIPEPSAALLLGAACLMGLTRRRRV